MAAFPRWSFFYSFFLVNLGMQPWGPQNGTGNRTAQLLIWLLSFFFLIVGVGGQRSDSFGNKLATVRGCPIGPNSTRLAMGLLGTLGTHLHLALVHTQRPKYLGAHGSPLISPHD